MCASSGFAIVSHRSQRTLAVYHNFVGFELSKYVRIRLFGRYSFACEFGHHLDRICHCVCAMPNENVNKFQIGYFVCSRGSSRNG